MLGLVGESGSGKTTLGRALLGLVRPTGGSVKLRGEELAGLPERQLRPKRRHLQMVFQDPHASLNPGMTLRDRARAPAADPQAHQGRRRDAGEGPRDARAGRPRRPSSGSRTELAERPLGRPEAARRDRAGDHHRPRPGGRRRARLDARHERAGEDPRPDDRPQDAARADVRLRHARPGVGAKFFCDRVAIMYLGRIVEIGTVERDLRRPQAPVHAGADPRDPGARPGQGAPARPAARRGARRGARRRSAARSTRAARRRSSICGWESRDLRAILEERWVERRRGGLHHRARRWSATSRSSRSAHEAFVPAGSGKDPGELLEDAREDPRRGARRAAVEGRQGDDRRGARRARDVRARASTRRSTTPAARGPPACSTSPTSARRALRGAPGGTAG